MFIMKCFPYPAVKLSVSITHSDAFAVAQVVGSQE
ncbi:hypothetical protein F441_02210 [Phytophthora nicotianae CJ01A1]|uniref:Uncharacterized protein n=3 Tax=Phytophthora nicotianae TaxID=4792 RepID=W3A0X8_PHYNI|nr:hypothetical protein L915_02146 [Phytophthora nicotianae]ETP24868.1 hypothetical protein F441_02210 [Phytophthora nicotianae CJ01A1]ETP52856.1 hypothetical protein F442_02194 [Phytophthora nicotianae P10297]